MRKGAPAFGAAQRTLAREHRSGISTKVSTGGSGGLGVPILLVGFEQVSAFLPPFHRPAEAERLRACLYNVRLIGDAIQQRFA